MEPVPESVTVNTGEQDQVQPTIDAFFQEAVDHVRERYPDRPTPEEVVVDCMIRSNDFMHYVAIYDVVLACVSETRNQFNYVHYTFFRNERMIEEFEKVWGKSNRSS